MTTTRPLGRWHGKRRYFGLHYDLHAGEKDTELGARCGEADLGPMLELMGPDFVQTDCKGHPGYTSWFSQVPEASVSPGVVKDALLQWRAAVALPLLGDLGHRGRKTAPGLERRHRRRPARRRPHSGENVPAQSIPGAADDSADARTD
ncbi:MAG: hypothetical protein BWZ02_01561 [Lentisphaerae bacterium ADurb.BinA184]|nr:MAG: hypothetical protein BWZ02_01561 [Lentisphaerae bacterium ADurb.BinA184]